MSYEETESDRAGGEGDSSRAHGIPDGHQYDIVYGLWPILRALESVEKRHSGKTTTPPLRFIYIKNGQEVLVV
jgi:hypothetical protein